MATKKKSKPQVKKTVTCGKCKEPGHNARTCPTKPAVKKVVAKAPSEAPVPVVEAKVEPAPKPVVPKPPKAPEVKKEERRKTSVPTRDAPTATRSGSEAPPYRCTKCNQVDILVIVRVIDHNASFKEGKQIFGAEMRCAKCMNKPTPSDLILKWGAVPTDKIPANEVPGNDG